MIEVSGFSVERFVNMAAYRGVYLWDISPAGTAVRMKASKDGRGILEECAKKTGCQFRVCGEKGLPGYLKRYQKRKILAAGVFFFIIGLYALSSFIWEVRVTGNERLTTEELLVACEEMGLKPGALRMRVNTEEITDYLAEKFADIAWVSVHITGTNAQVRLVEAIPKPQMMDRNTPCDIVASKDGLIQSIAVETGTPKVKAGDVVEKGDLLISSEVSIAAGEEQLGVEWVRARGKVYGKLWHQLEEELPLEYTTKEYTGKIMNDHSIVLHDSVLNILQPKTEDSLYDVTTEYEKILAIGDYKLGASIKKEIFREYNEIPQTRTVDQAKTELEELINQKARALEGEDGEILDIVIEYEEFEDKVKAKAAVTVTERLDEEKNKQAGSEEMNGTTNGENPAN